MTAIGQKGVDLMLSDSTNASVEKFSLSEADVRDTLDELVGNIKGRIVIATFASNVYRVREIINIAVKYKRKIVINGYSMDKVVDIARRIKYINAPSEIFMDLRELKRYDGDDVVIISTGTQGEENAGISKMANGKHKQIKLKNTDTVIFASSAIPGNYEGVDIITNKLIKLGVKVINNKDIPSVHASGHGGSQEQLLMFNLIKPRYFMPVHGETAMQVRHGQTAVKTGVNKNNVFILSNGQRLKLEYGKVTQDGAVPTDDIYVDDTNLKGQSLKVIANREKMSENGVMTISVGIDASKNKVICPPVVKIVGIFHQETNGKILEDIEEATLKDLETYYKNNDRISFAGIKEIIRNTGERVIFDERRLSPIVIPVVLNYKESNKTTKEKDKDK